jgi:hypothetical protein
MSISVRSEIEKAKGARFTYFAEGYMPADRAQHDEWVAQIRAEYDRRGKEFLLSNNGDGCAVFGVHTNWLVPADCADPVAWIRRHLKPLMAETGIFAELRAARDAKEAARAKLMAGNVFFHTGDLGDIIAALPAIRALGGGYLILGNRHGRGGRELMSPERFAVIEPLLSAQPYIAGVELCDDAPNQTGCCQSDRKSVDSCMVARDITWLRGRRVTSACRNWTWVRGWRCRRETPKNGTRRAARRSLPGQSGIIIRSSTGRG